MVVVNAEDSPDYIVGTFLFIFVLAMLDLLLEIKSLQIQSNSAAYREGIFPSQRKYSISKTTYEDDNCFFTALIAFTLLRLKKYLSPEECNVVDSIKHEAQKAFSYYRNTKEYTYNFWRTEKNAHFPNSKLFSKYDYFRLADDADCTALIYLVNSVSDYDTIYLKSKLLYHATTPAGISSNTLRHYRRLKLYSTWFGKNIPVESDLCVITNLLYLVFEKKLLLNEYDMDCIKFICSVIQNDEHKTQPFRIAPYYPKTSIILYHIARLMTIAKNPALLQLRQKLRKDIFQKLLENIHPMEKIILNTSLMWLGETVSIQNLKMPEKRDFPWFIAGMLTSVNNPLTRVLAPLPLFHIQFYCEAYMKTLYMEYKAEKDNLLKKKQ